jgi:hypothetical protein
MTGFAKLRLAAAPLLLIAGLPLAAQEEATTIISAPSTRAPIADPALVERYNFDFVLQLSEDEFASTLEASDLWRAASEARRSRIESEIAACGDNAPCRIGALLWTDGEVQNAFDAISTALGKTDNIQPLAAQMRDSGVYARYAQMSDENLIAAAWQDATDGHNRILRVYGLGEPSLYPRIDSTIFDPTGDLWPGVMIEATNQLLLDPVQSQGPLPVSDLAHRFALRLLHLNERENGGFFPDLDALHNAAVASRVPEIEWNAYPYSVILVLGDGPDRPDQLVGTYGKMRLARAARLYREGKAPFLVVSGGNVHPALTPFNEAIEMKRELMQRYGIPADAIIIEPHARHTTTNFRNTARLMIRYGIPLDKPAIATTSEGHSQYAGGEGLDQKAMEEIGFVPRRVVRRLTRYEIEFLADPRSTHRDSIDPLDP